MERFLGWLTELPAAALYLALAVMAGVENIVPPLPSDTVVAFGSFLAARGEASLAGAFLATWGGNILGAMLMYGVGRRFGATRFQERFEGQGGTRQRISALYGKYGVIGLGLSRFLPGVRALVPPVAGAMRVPVLVALLAFALPSAIWYGAITVLAYRLGTDWDRLQAAVMSGSKWTGIVATGIALLAVAIWWLRRQRRRQ